MMKMSMSFSNDETEELTFAEAEEKKDMNRKN